MSDDISTTDRAFQVWTSVIAAETGRPYWKTVNEHTAFVAGVREGIRQAREAAANVDPVESALNGADAAVWAIDALT